MSDLSKRRLRLRRPTRQSIRQNAHSAAQNRLNSANWIGVPRRRRVLGARQEWALPQF